MPAVNSSVLSGWPLSHNLVNSDGSGGNRASGAVEIGCPRELFPARYKHAVFDARKHFGIILKWFGVSNMTQNGKLS
jgi:hypothetical protein